ncbi:PilZ domain-containing protein [Reinekea marina]|uniref:Cyclic diguanosine monophosphate-binding protein n=2 Tax=Reinekea marina TaxID=1310421 RepID=A0ABV7WLU9_9GAMM
MTEEKRRFQRIPFDSNIVITLPDQAQISGELHDISLKGALVCLPESTSLPALKTQCAATVSPSDDSWEIAFDGEIAYVNESAHTFGLSIIKLELDSASLLRRLIEVNLGDEAALQRELDHLINQ